MSEIKTPLLEKMVEVKNQSQMCGEFLRFLLEKYDVFDRSQPREEPYYIGASDYINTEHLFAEFFKIDLEQVEKERQLLMESLIG